MIISPLYIDYEFSKKEGIKRYYLNFNNYRNWHYQISNRLKKQYSKIMMPQLIGKKFTGKLIIEYKYYARDKRDVDLDNMVTVHKKFIQDSLVKYNCIEDDNINYIVGNREDYCGVDKHNPRVEIIIKRID